MVRRTTLTHFGVLLGLTALAVMVRETRLTAFRDHQDAERYEAPYYLPPPDWLPIMSLGYTNAVADLIWCRTLIYFGNELVKSGAVRHIFSYADAIITLDPDFRAPYKLAPTIAMYKPGEFDWNEAQRAADYLRTAVHRWPNDGELAWDLGSLLRFEIAPHVKDKDLRRKLDEEAAEYLSTAALLGAGPPWLALNSTALLQKLGRKQQAIRHLEEVYGTVQDPTTKATIAQQLASLRSEAYATAMAEANDQLEAVRKRDLPYVDSSLFFVLGPKANHDRTVMIERNFLPADSVSVVLEE